MFSDFDFPEENGPLDPFATHHSNLEDSNTGALFGSSFTELPTCTTSVGPCGIDQSVPVSLGPSPAIEQWRYLSQAVLGSNLNELSTESFKALQTVLADFSTAVEREGQNRDGIGSFNSAPPMTGGFTSTRPPVSPYSTDTSSSSQYSGSPPVTSSTSSEGGSSSSDASLGGKISLIPMEFTPLVPYPGSSFYGGHSGGVGRDPSENTTGDVTHSVRPDSENDSTNPPMEGFLLTQTHISPPPKMHKKRNTTRRNLSADERRKILEDDDFVLWFNETRVICSGCGRERALDHCQKAKYYLQFWKKHRRNCQGVQDGITKNIRLCFINLSQSTSTPDSTSFD